MLSRRTVLAACILVLTATIAGGAYGVATGTPAAPYQLFMPQLAHDEPALTQIVGLANSSHSFWNSQEPDYEIYTLRADGTGLTRLTDNDWQDSGANWSPDGSLILWKQYDVSGPSSVYDDVWLMNSDGSNARDISHLPGSDGGVWSPSGNEILIWSYDREAPAGRGEALYITTPAATKLTPVIVDVGLGNAGWSPTGTYISFVTHSADYVYDLHIARADGSNVTLVASDINQSYSWSPNGSWLAYEKESADNLDVYISRPDGSETRPLATTPADERLAGWVEQGARLLVRRVVDEGDGTNALDLVSVTGATTPFAANVGVYGISPDGTKVVYLEELTEGNYQLNLRDTNSLIPLTISPEFSLCPLCSISFGGWSDDGRQVAYTFVTTFSVGIRDCALYVANVDGSNPIYQLVDPASCGASWLPHSSWLSTGGNNGYTLLLINPRTGARLTMPRSFDDTLLCIEEWRYMP